MSNRRTSQSKIENIVRCKCISLLNSPSTPGKTPQGKPTDETHLQQNLEDDHLILLGKGGGLAVYVESEYLFPIICGRQYSFSSKFSTDHSF